MTGRKGANTLSFPHNFLDTAHELSGLFRDFSRWRHTYKGRQTIEHLELGILVCRQFRRDNRDIEGGHVEGQALVEAVKDGAATSGNR